MTSLIPARLFEKVLHERPSSGAKHELYGLEIFPGVGTPLSRTTRYGATFAAAGTFALVIGWVNYTPIFFKPNTTCSVAGGRWLFLSRGGLRPKVSCGVFTGGEVRWNRSAKIALASLHLESSGCAGILTAALNHLPFPPLPPRIGGVLTLERGGPSRRRGASGPS